MRKILIPLLLLVFCSSSLHAQSARKVLDATAARLTESGGVKAQFKATQFSGTTSQGEATGTMLISGNKFHMKSDELTTWFDGHTEWTMMTGSNEVNVTSPNEEELAAINPAALVGIYKKGYKSSLSTSTLRGRSTYVVYLRAKSRKAAFSEIYVDVDKATYDPLCIRAKKDGDWMRLSILSFQCGLKLPDETFTFPTKDHPNVETIDLR